MQISSALADATCKYTPALIQFSWQVIFLVLALFSVICLVWSYVDFEDTLPIDKRSTKPWSGVLGEYLELLKDKRFLLPAVASGMLMGALFVYINASAELLIDYFGLSSTWYSWVFGANAAGLIAMTKINIEIACDICSLESRSRIAARAITTPAQPPSA